MLHVRTADIPDADVVALRQGRDVLVCVSDDHLSKRGAKSITAALRHLELTEERDPLDEVC